MSGPGAARFTCSEQVTASPTFQTSLWHTKSGGSPGYAKEPGTTQYRTSTPQCFGMPLNLGFKGEQDAGDASSWRNNRLTPSASRGWRDRHAHATCARAGTHSFTCLGFNCWSERSTHRSVQAASRLRGAHSSAGSRLAPSSEPHLQPPGRRHNRLCSCSSWRTFPKYRPSCSAEKTLQRFVTEYSLCARRRSLRTRRPKLAYVKGYFFRKEH